MTELFDMLKKAEANIKKGTGFKKPGKDKGGNKAVQISDRDRPVCSVKPKSGPSYECSFCKEQGHLVTSCNRFLEGLDQLMKKYGLHHQVFVLLNPISTIRHLMPIVMLLILGMQGH